ncbi:MAG: hypothetical protein ACI9F9_002331, partial [Candidatus Paceibacteria bacterium]
PTAVLESSGGRQTRLDLEAVSLAAMLESKPAFLRFESPAGSAGSGTPENQVRVELVAGGHAIGDLQGGDGEFLDVRLMGGALLRLSLEEFSSLRLPGRFPAAWTEPVGPAPEGDRLYRRSGPGLDRIDGAIETFDREGVTMDTALGIKTFPWLEVAALFVEVFDETRSNSDLGQVVVDLLDGSRLPMGLQDLGPDGLSLVTASGRGFRLPLEVIAEIFFADSGVVFLSDLEPAKSEDASPFGDNLGMVWSARKDLSVTGAPLRAGGKRWTRGLGVHGPSRIEYSLDGSWNHLRGFVAIDDQVIPLAARGSVIFRILNGETVLWESAVIHGADAPQSIPAVSIAGVKRLVLEVDTADNLHLGDRANWLRVVLSKEEFEKSSGAK